MLKALDVIELRVAVDSWEPGTIATVLEVAPGSVLAEVSDDDGRTLDILAIPVDAAKLVEGDEVVRSCPKMSGETARSCPETLPAPSVRVASRGRKAWLDSALAATGHPVPEPPPGGHLRASPDKHCQCVECDAVGRWEWQRHGGEGPKVAVANGERAERPCSTSPSRAPGRERCSAARGSEQPSHTCADIAALISHPCEMYWSSRTETMTFEPLVAHLRYARSLSPLCRLCQHRHLGAARLALRYPEATHTAVAFGDQPLSDGQRPERPRPQLLANLGEELLDATRFDVAAGVGVDPGCP